MFLQCIILYSWQFLHEFFENFLLHLHSTNVNIIIERRFTIYSLGMTFGGNLMGDYRKVIAICGTWLYEEKEYGFVSELNRMCRKKGYIPFAFNFSIDSMNIVDDVIRENKLMDLMGNLNCAAVIIMGETIKSERMLDSILKTVTAMQVPVFAMEKHIDGCINVAMRYGEGFKNIVRHVIDFHGCRKVNMIAGVRDNDFSDDRIRAYKEVLAEHGIPFEEKRLAYGEFWDRPARDSMEAFLQDEELPEAVVCANDSMAIAACDVIKEHGLRVPEDIIVTGFDGIFSAKVNTPTIATVAPDNASEIEYIFSLLENKRQLKKMLNKGDAMEPKYIEFKICPAGSCGCHKERDNEISNLLTLSLSDQKWHMATMNKLLLSANDKDQLTDLPPILKESVHLWMQNFYFIAVHNNLVDGSYHEDADNPYAENTDTTYYNLFRLEHAIDLARGDVFDESVLIPGMRKLFHKDSGYEMFMVKLLYTKSNLYGYLIEGFQTLDERAMRRCEEYGLFLSTTLDSVIKNNKLMLLNKRLRQINKEIQNASIRDYLTDLYNRRGFYDELYKLVRDFENRDRYLTFFSIDMDGLKIINDTYGHNEGDFSLKALASAIRHFALRNGICARYGGDEFVCAIITDLPTKFNPEIVRGRFQSVFDKNKELMAKPYTISASIGCRCAQINDALNLDELMRIADEDMYIDKQSRRKSRV